MKVYTLIAWLSSFSLSCQVSQCAVIDCQTHSAWMACFARIARLSNMPRWQKLESSLSIRREREMFYLTTHSTHFIYGYMASDIWLRTILIVREETRCHHIGYSFRLAARVLLYAPSHRQDSTYHGLCYTSRGALAGMRNSSMGPPHEGSIRRPIAPWANALPLSYVPLLNTQKSIGEFVVLISLTLILILFQYEYYFF